MFRKFDKDKSGQLTYVEFKKIWLQLANVKEELLARGLSVVGFHWQLVKRLVKNKRKKIEIAR